MSDNTDHETSGEADETPSRRSQRAGRATVIRGGRKVEITAGPNVERR